MNQQIADVVGATVLQSLKEEEQRVDAELQKLNQLEDDDLERIRENRLKQMKLQAQQATEWKSKGHGEYTEIADQHQFFATTKESKQVLVHFYTPTNRFCEIVDRHFQHLAPKHLETKFCKMNAEKSEFLVNKLGIWMIPTILLCKDREMIHKISGFDELGGTDQFSSRYLEYVLSQHKVLRYDGPIPESVMDEEPNDRMNLTRKPKGSVRQSVYYDSDLEED